jgi:RNA polymerase sigma factor (sigma-70 family)
MSPTPGLQQQPPAWETILRTHGPMAFDTAWRLLGHTADADDAVQEAFLDAFKLYSRQPIENWGGLLRSLATRRAIDRLRSRRSSMTAIKTEPPAAVSDQPECAAIEHELAHRLRQAVATLPDREATVFSLRYFGEMTNPMIAETLNITLDAVGMALHKARAKLKDALGLEGTIRKGKTS